MNEQIIGTRQVQGHVCFQCFAIRYARRFASCYTMVSVSPRVTLDVYKDKVKNQNC